MNGIDRMLEGFDLTIIHAILTFIGLFATVYVMQLTSFSEISRLPQSVQLMSRFGLAVMSWGLLWSLGFAFQKDWQPWPPQLIVYLGIDVVMVTRAYTLSARARQFKERSSAYRALHH